MTRLVALAVIAIGCTTEVRTVLHVTSDLEPGREIDRLLLSYGVASGPTRHESELFELVPPGVRTPARRTSELPIDIGLFGQAGLPVEARVSLFRGPIPIASRDLLFDLFSGTLPVTVDRECARALCPAGTTCAPGWGCVPPRVRDDGVPYAEPAGPSCRCQSFLPVCVGARWDYAECPLDVSDPERCPVKQIVIADYGKIGERSGPRELDERFGKSDVEAFVQARRVAIDRSRRWMSLRGSQFLWEKNQWFDEGWTLTRSLYATPAAIRFDESLRGELSQRYVEIDQVVGRPERVTEIESTWTVTDITDPLIPRPWRERILREFPRRFGAPLCHRRHARETTDGETVAVEKVYCYVFMVGKVLEISANNIEYLVRWQTPCR